MYDWAGAISNPAINSQTFAFSYFETYSSPFKDKNQIGVALKDIMLRIEKHITGNSLDIGLYTKSF